MESVLGPGSVLDRRGYVHDGQGVHVIPTVHPLFIRQGQSKYAAAFIHDIQKATEIARDGLPFHPLEYLLDPLPGQAYEWAKRYRASGARFLAYDIETPYKGADEGDLDPSVDVTYKIDRIGFSFKPYTGMSIPWEGPYLPAIKLLLESEGDKVVWNSGFDTPRVRFNGVKIAGLIHDGMVAWHVLHSDLPKGLGFVATFTCPDQSPWKHLSHARPAFYNCTDADVELRSMIAIEAKLREHELWDVYQRDVLDLDPILNFMSEQGMPIDAETRHRSAVELDSRLKATHRDLESLMPLPTRKVEHVYVNTPADTEGLLTRPGTRLVKVCPNCGATRPRKDHFKRFVKKINPCADGVAVEVEQSVVEYYRLAAFKPSREQLIRYNDFLKRRTPTTRDKKSGQMRLTTDEKAIKTLILKYPDDPVYNMILTYRELDKLAGTYIGRPGGQ